MERLKRRTNGTLIALVVSLAALGSGYAAGASGAALSEGRADSGVSPWLEAESVVTSDATPANDVAGPTSGPGPGLQIGLVLIGLAVPLLTYGVVATTRARPPVGLRFGAPRGGRLSAGRSRLETYQRL